MIIFKPDWVTHSDVQKKSCIFTLDVSPDGTCLATGSLDGSIKLWNTLPIYNEEAEKNILCPKLLFTLSSHQGAVLCLRWSNDNRYLASCSDRDNTIIIWEKKQGQWEPKHQLKGHNAEKYIDVQGLAWSRDNDYLASCSVDGSIIIWDGYTFENVEKIIHHSGRVNGIVWDPTGQYLASQADDKTIKIWKTSDWTLDTTIRNPFFHTSSTALFTRLSHKPVAAIISRDDWGSDVSLVGHRHPVEITSFNPKLFYINEDNPLNGITIKSISSICALGSQDRSVSIWMTKSSKPICVTTDLFSDNIYDIAWAPDGRSLFACSRDGTVVCLQLPEELEDDVPDETVVSNIKSEKRDFPFF
ncbi:WD40-repeat-containing domain protein [Sporodiniella umbellata]|nr:WD40-repeat-containing domain protein [Sporodiniella umbellata]